MQLSVRNMVIFYLMIALQVTEGAKVLLDRESIGYCVGLVYQRGCYGRDNRKTSLINQSLAKCL